MKYFAFLVLMFASSNIFAQANANTNTEEGEVVFIRPLDIQNWLINFSVFANDQKVSNLGNGYFMRYKMKAGKHVVSLQASGKRRRKKAALTPIEVQAGKTTYVLLSYQQRVIRDLYTATEITEASSQTFFKQQLKEKKLKTNS